MVQKGKPQNDENSHHLGMAVICVMVHGVVIKVEDMTQEQGLRISAAVENALYILCGITGHLCAAHALWCQEVSHSWHTRLCTMV